MMTAKMSLLAFLLTAEAAVVGMEVPDDADVAHASEGQALVETEAASPKNSKSKLAAAAALAMLTGHAAEAYQVNGALQRPATRAATATAARGHGLVTAEDFALESKLGKLMRAGAPAMQLGVGDGLGEHLAGRSVGRDYFGDSRPGAGPRAGDPPPQIIQGGSLRTWAFKSPAVEQVQVVLSTEGRPLDADIELWQGPDNTPIKARVYVENGAVRPFSTVLETPRGPNTVAVRNIGQDVFPVTANVLTSNVDHPTQDALDSGTTVQGGALRTYPFDPSVESVQVLLKTDGRPLNARVELLQGPNNNKQVIELYTEDGMDRPFFAVLETPGAGNVVRVVNTAPMEFPMTASVVPYTVNPLGNTDPILGGDVVLGGEGNW